MTGGTLGKIVGATLPLHEMLGVASGSGIFTQSGGVNIPYVETSDVPQDGPPTISAVELGYSNGGYGEYDMSGGSVGADVLYVGASDFTIHNSTMNAGTGVFNQTGGSVGSLGALGLVSTTSKAVGLMVGGNWGHRVGHRTAPPRESTLSATRTAPARRSWSAAASWWVLPALALSTRIAEPTPLSAEGTMLVLAPGTRALSTMSPAASPSAGIAAIKSPGIDLRLWSGDVQP